MSYLAASESRDGDPVDDWGQAIAGIDGIAREAMLFACVGFLIGGLDDLAVDVVYLWHRAKRRMTSARSMWSLDDLSSGDAPGRIVVFVPVWDEARVIGAMLRTALARLEYPDYRLYVGCYPNDPATIDAVAAVAKTDSRVRLVVGVTPGPTTKAGCLNTLWRALCRDEAAEDRRVKAVVLHDAEDLVHASELRLFDALIGGYQMVQIPVLPLIDGGASLVSGHYADEFAESHGKTLIVRQVLGAALPLAGVGCAIARDCLGRMAAARGGSPFDAASLTEDYELGLQVARFGGRCLFARVNEAPGEPPIAVREYFPARFEAAIRQKTRWMIGISLAGWDRTGWARARDWRDHWMRMRDRRAPLAVLVLIAAYVAAMLWLVGVGAHWVSGMIMPQLPPALDWLLGVNSSLLLWRLAVRAAFTGRTYGWRQALWSVPRAFVGNFISMVAAQRALIRYAGMLRGRPPRWDKTEHVFPDDVVDRA